jgi:ferredoxin
VNNWVGEFEKPKYFNYKANICAHGRNKKTACTQCIDVCSTKAIRSVGERIEVTPQLCMGCGACSTVCPSGALTYVYPTVPDMGTRLKTVLNTYAKAGGKDAVLLLHDQGGEATLAKLAKGQGLSANVIPLAVHHVASLGLDIWLAAISAGANQVWCLLNDNTAETYREALLKQQAIGQTVLNSLGYQGQHLRVVNPAELAATQAQPKALGVRTHASFALTTDKRASLGMSFEHLLQHAPTPKTIIPLAIGAPFGEIKVNTASCTLCMSCVGACPEGAIVDNPEAPELRFIEKQCVQCCLCEQTCPEQAISLVPRLNLTESASKKIVLNTAQIAGCIRCQKPLGTVQMIEGMMKKLAGHSMFADEASRNRLRMCADCRVADLYTDENPMNIRQLP